jgi:hypothetical protein
MHVMHKGTKALSMLVQVLPKGLGLSRYGKPPESSLRGSISILPGIAKTKDAADTVSRIRLPWVPITGG